MDANPLTMRQLVRMAKARQQFEGDLICYLATCIPRGIQNAFESKPFEFRNPWRDFSPDAARQLEELNRWRRKRRNQLLCSPKKPEPCQ